MSEVATGSKQADPLRKQLDELDQLMERMLALGGQPPPAQPAREESPHIVSQEAIADELPETIVPDAANQIPPSLPEFAPPVEVPYRPEVDFWKPLVESAVARIEPVAPLVDIEPDPALELAPSAPTFVSLEGSVGTPPAPLFAEFQFAPPPSIPSLEPTVAPLAIRTSAPPDPIVIVALWLQPLALVNRVYDGSTRWLGPIGRGLRSRPMRNLMGICGVACVLGALAWMLWEGTDWNS